MARMELSVNGVSALITETLESSHTPSLRTGTARRQLSTNQETGPPHTQNLPAP